MQLREAKRLSREAETEVSAYKADAENARSEANQARRDADAKVRQMKQDLSDREKAADAKEARLNEIEADVEGEVGKRVDNLSTKKLNALEKDYKAKNKALNDKYDRMTTGYKGRYHISLFYGILVTVLMGGISDTFRSEVSTFFVNLFYGLAEIVSGIWNIGGFVAKLGDMLDSGIVGAIIHWILQLVVSVGGGALLVALAINGIVKFKEFFKKNYADEITVLVMLMALAVIVICADYVALLPVNLIVLYILVFVGYMVIRAFMAWEDEEAKKNLLVYVGLTIFIFLAVWFGLRSLASDLRELGF